MTNRGDGGGGVWLSGLEPSLGDQKVVDLSPVLGRATTVLLGP